MWLVTWWYEDGLPTLELPHWSTLEVGQVLSGSASSPGRARPRDYRLLEAGVMVAQVEVRLFTVWEAVTQAVVELPLGSRHLTVTEGASRRDSLAPLLAAVVHAESPPATRLWLWCRDDDLTAAADAGFGIVGRVIVRSEQPAVLHAATSNRRAVEGAAVFGLALDTEA